MTPEEFDNNRAEAAADAIPPDDDHDEGADEPSSILRRINPLRVIGTVVGAVAAIFAGYAALPYVLAPYIVEGPFVQQPGETTMRIAWFASRTGEFAVRYELGGQMASANVTNEGRRYEAELKQLIPASEVAYEIQGADDAVLHAARCQTNKPAGMPFRFAVLGDSGAGTAEQFKLAGLMTEAVPDFALHTGDLIYSGGERYRYRGRFFAPYAKLIERVAFWPSIGNHDDSKETHADPYREVFALPVNGPTGVTPENAYWFTYGDALVVILDSNLESAELETQRDWLRGVFEDHVDARWRFVVFHHPPYTVGSHKPHALARDLWTPVFDEFGVDFVFNGHDHLYSRTHPMVGGEAAGADVPGTVYIISGAGGQRLYDFRPRDEWPNWMAVGENKQHSFTLVDVNSARCVVVQIGVDGRELDRQVFEKAAAGGVVESAAH